MGNRFPKERTRATIQDVAAAAGVTKGTVSKYLNRQPGTYVAEETAARIERVIRELNFQPSAIARGLTHRRTMTIGVVAPDLRNPYYPDVVAGVQSVMDPEGYTILLSSSLSDPESERRIIRSMIGRRVDGIVLASVRIGEDDLSIIREAGTHVVLASRDLPGTVADTAVVDNYAGALRAVEHLRDHGHTRIAHMAGPQNVHPFF